MFVLLVRHLGASIAFCKKAWNTLTVDIMLLMFYLHDECDKYDQY